MSFVHLTCYGAVLTHLVDAVHEHKPRWLSGEPLLAEVAIATAPTARRVLMVAFHSLGLETVPHQAKGTKQVSPKGGRKVNLKGTVVVLDDATRWLAAFLCLQQKAVGHKLQHVALKWL